MNNTFAIINFIEGRDILSSLVNPLLTSKRSDDEVYVFVPHDKTVETVPGVKVVNCPESVDTKPKAKNYVSRYFKDKQSTKGFLHIIEDDALVVSTDEVITLSDGTNAITKKSKIMDFIDKLQEMMIKLDINTWMNTSSDVCNYVFDKYTTRIEVVVDDEFLSSFYKDRICFTSHANPMWLTFNLDNIELDKMMFDEEFEIPMYYIIGYLACRRNDVSDRGCNFMNFYPTVPNEIRYILRNQNAQHSNLDVRKEMEREGQLFQAKGIDYHPNTNIDEVMDLIHARLSEYAAKNPITIS